MDMQKIYIRTVIKKSIFGKKTQNAYHSEILRNIVLSLIPMFTHFVFITTVLYGSGNKELSAADNCLNLTFTAVLALYLHLRLKRRRDGFIKWLTAFPADSFQALCGQTELSGEKFRTLYLLDDYLYIHKDMLMIRYDEIKDFSSHLRYESTAMGKICRAVLKIQLENNKKIKVDFPGSYSFEKEYRKFEIQLRNKIENRENDY